MSKKVGEQIRKRRLELCYSQLQLAEKCGYKTKGSISRIEKGETDLNQDQIQTFAKALNTSPSYIMGWVDDPNYDPLKDKYSDVFEYNVDIRGSEYKLLEKYRSAPQHIKDAINSLLQIIE